MSVDYLQGWDVILAVRQSRINAGLLKAYAEGKIPKDFDASFTIPIFGFNIDVHMKGTFGPMQLTGGTGQIGQVLLPVATGSITGPNGFHVDISGAQALVSLNLSDVMSPIQPAQGTSYDLLLDFTNPNAFVGITLSSLPPPLQDQAATIATVLVQYLQTQTKGQTYRIATFDLKNWGIVPDYPDLVPRLARYAMRTDPTTSAQNTFAMLFVTISQNLGVIDVLPGTIPDGNDSAVHISNPIFISEFVVPALAKGFNVDESRLIVHGSPALVENAGNIVTTIDADGPKQVTIERLRVQVADDQTLSIVLTVRYTVSPGIDLVYTIDPSRYRFVVTEQDGKEYLALQEVDFRADKRVDIEWWVWVVGGAAAILLLPIVPILLAAIAAGIGVAIVAIVQAIVQAKAPDLKNSVIVQAAGSTQWNYADLLRVTQVLLPLGMQAGGFLAIEEPSG